MKRTMLERRADVDNTRHINYAEGFASATPYHINWSLRTCFKLFPHVMFFIFHIDITKLCPSVKCIDIYDDGLYISNLFINIDVQI